MEMWSSEETMWAVLVFDYTLLRRSLACGHHAYCSCLRGYKSLNKVFTRGDCDLGGERVVPDATVRRRVCSFANRGVVFRRTGGKEVTCDDSQCRRQGGTWRL